MALWLGWIMASWMAFWSATVLLGLARASPTISFPINAQVPPVARIGQAFSLVFSPSTFSSPSPIRYSLSNPPGWLSVDSEARRLYGTPRDEEVSPGNVVGVPIGLVATDSTGMTTLSATLVVARDPAPTIRIPLSQQITGFGTYSPPSSLLSYPDKEFAFAFAENTFSKPGLNYYAVTGENAPLPAWVSFDPGKLAFAGRTPPLSSLVEHPQNFAFKLVASDITGFSATSMDFSIVVGNYEITVGEPVVTLNATVGSLVSYTALSGLVKMDSQPAQPGTLSASASGLPDWLSFNQATWEISGTPPQGAKDASFLVAFEDESSNRANVTVQVHVTTGLFQGTLPALEAERGRRFTFDLKPFLWKPSDVRVTARVNPTENWINFDAEALTWSGDVPSDLADQAIAIIVRVASKTSEATETQRLNIKVLPPASASSISPSQPSSSASASEVGKPESPKGPPSINTTLVAILLPILLLTVAFIVIFFCFYRRRRNRLSRRLERKDVTSSSRLERKDISGPVPGSFVRGDGDSGLNEMGKQYDIGNTNALAAYQPRQQKAQSITMARSLRKSRSAEGIPPIPSLPPVALAGKTQSLSDSAGHHSWFSGGAALLSGNRARKSKSKSYLSDTSLYEDDPMIMNLMSYSRDSTCRDRIKSELEPPLEPASSIQHTPDMAYTGSRTKTGYRGVDPPARQFITPRQPRVAEPLSSRPKSRLDNHSPGSYDKRSSRPPPKLVLPPRLVNNPKQRKKPADPLGAGASENRESVSSAHLPSQRGVNMTHRPRPAYMTHTRTMSRPVSRRGEEDAAFWAGSGSGRTRPASSRSSTTAPPLPEVPALSKARESWARKKAAAASRQTHGGRRAASRDPLGVSYEELVTDAPFHPASSTSWETLPPEVHEPNWIVHDVSVLRDEWRDVGEGSDETAGSLTSDSISDSNGDNRRPLATVSQTLGSGNSSVGRAVSRYSKLNLDEGSYQENRVRVGSNGSARSEVSAMSEDFVVYV